MCGARALNGGGEEQSLTRTSLSGGRGEQTWRGPQLTVVAVGDTVGVFGEGEGASIMPKGAESQLRTIMAELYTDWGQRNPRLYL